MVETEWYLVRCKLLLYPVQQRPHGLIILKYIVFVLYTITAQQKKNIKTSNLACEIKMDVEKNLSAPSCVTFINYMTSSTWFWVQKSHIEKVSYILTSEKTWVCQESRSRSEAFMPHYTVTRNINLFHDTDLGKGMISTGALAWPRNVAQEASLRWHLSAPVLCGISNKKYRTI